MPEPYGSGILLYVFYCAGFGTPPRWGAPEVIGPRRYENMIAELGQAL